MSRFTKLSRRISCALAVSVFAAAVLLIQMQSETVSWTDQLARAKDNKRTDSSGLESKSYSLVDSKRRKKRLIQFKERATASGSHTKAVAAFESQLLSFNGETDDDIVSACLTRIRKFGSAAIGLQPTLLDLMSERAKLYSGRAKPEVLRLRAYVLLTLYDTGNSKSAFPYICDYIKNSDDYGLAFEVGSAVRAASALGPQGRDLLDALAVAFHRDLTEPEFSLERYSHDFPQTEATTVRLEIIKAFQSIGFRGNRRVEQLLEACASTRNRFSREDARLVKAASNALENSSNHLPDTTLPPLRIGIKERSKDLQEDLLIRYEDQDGNQGLLSDLVDRPTAIVFFYTRCTNTQKCSATIARVAKLQMMLKDAGIINQVRLIGITYEPKGDDSTRLKNYGLSRNVTFDANTLFLRLDQKEQDSLIASLDVPVSYNDGWVSVHGIVLFVLSKEQVLVRRHDTIAWKNKLVVEELASLID